MPLPTSSFPDPPPRAEMFNNSNRVTINGGKFQAIGSQTNHNHYNANNNIGLMELYRTSMPEATHDSSARKYAPKCYPGTREQHIQDFTLWASNNVGQQQCRFRMSWMEGPFGVGKSTIAQTCAGKVGEDLLGATFFFSRPNHRDDPDRFFPSIAYQISTKVKPLSDILNEKICNDPSVLTKTIQVQFQELIVLPFLELKERGSPIQERVVIIDGLDECRDDHAQCEIIELIATAVREHGENLPLLWAFFSRPEPHIARTFFSEITSPLVWTMSLPVSREIDKEIELYIRGQFRNIQKRIYHVPSRPNDTWPSESQISALVYKSAGLFVHASTAMKYVGDPEALDPKDRLEEVVSLHFPKPIAMSGPSPTAELDSLYTLVMRRIPPHVLHITQQILLFADEIRLPGRSLSLAPAVEMLGLSLPSVMAALSKLHSVLAVDERSFSLTFHHASFMEFLTDVHRSGAEFCITQPQHYNSLLKRALVFLEPLSPAWSDAPRDFLRPRDTYSSTITYLTSWICFANIDEELALLLTRFDFAKHHPPFFSNGLEALYAKLSQVYRDQVIQRYQLLPSLPKQPNLDFVSSNLAMIYVLGQGEKSWRYGFDEYGRDCPIGWGTY